MVVTVVAQPLKLAIATKKTARLVPRKLISFGEFNVLIEAIRWEDARTLRG